MWNAVKDLDLQGIAMVIGGFVLGLIIFIGIFFLIDELVKKIKKD